MLDQKISAQFCWLDFHANSSVFVIWKPRYLPTFGIQFYLAEEIKEGNESGRQEMEEWERNKYNPTNLTLFQCGLGFWFNREKSRYFRIMCPNKNMN